MHKNQRLDYFLIRNLETILKTIKSSTESVAQPFSHPSRGDSWYGRYFHTIRHPVNMANRTLTVLLALFLCGTGQTVQADSLPVTFDLSPSNGGVALQFDVTPNASGVTFDNPSLLNASPHVVTSGVISNGVTRFVVYTADNTVLNPAGQMTVALNVTSASSLTDGMISISNVILSNVGGTNVNANVDARPVVISTTPGYYRSALVGSPLSLRVEAIDPNGAIASAVFRIDGSTVNTDTTRPYSFNYTPTTAGTKSYEAIVTGGADKTTTSDSVAFRAYQLSDINSFAVFKDIHYGSDSNDPVWSAPDADPLDTGFNNLLAYLAGVNPWDPDFAMLPKLQREANGALVYRFRKLDAVSDVAWSMTRSDNLALQAWPTFVPLSQAQSGVGGGRTEFALTVSDGTEDFRYYKLQLQLLP
jgi:hypothetical protein